MLVQEKLDEIFTIYNKVTLFSDKNDCKAMRLRHKELSRDLVLHILEKPVTAYSILNDILCDNMPEIYDVFECDDGVIVLEEFIDGDNIAVISENGKIKQREAVRIAKSVCLALAVLHNNGIVHRDIKPENVMISKSGNVKLIDFNASRIMSAKSGDTVIMGTIGYAAPEQLGLSQSDKRADIYAVGVLLNIMLTGLHPTEKIAGGYLGHIIKKCTNLNANRRYQTALQLYRALCLA
ncbi:MAG: serine/threonine-protein kinase [Clostridia bacterium]|nr:serine/threonine-protein kinase [Clostridia bacterium]